MPITVSHVLSATTPDDPAYEIRPSHWNSAHNVSLGPQTVYVVGNTTGASSSSTYAQDSLSFRGAGNVSIGHSNGTIVVSGGTASPSPIVFSAGTASASISSVVFSNSNGVSFGLNGSTITGSVAAIPTAYVQSVNGSSGALSLNVGSSLSSSTNGSSITFGLASNITTALQSAGAYLTSQSNQAFSASGGSSAFQTLNFANSNGATFSNTNGSVALSYTVPTVTQYISATNTTFNGTNISGSITHNTAGLRIDLSVAGAGGAASQTLYATGNTTVNSSGTMPLSSLLYRGYGILSLGTSNGSVLFSSPDTTDFAPMSVGFSTGGNTAGNTGIVSNRVVLAGGANITLSGSTNAGSMTISIAGGAGGGGGGIGAGISNLGNTAGTSGMVTTGNVVFVGSGPVSLSQSSSGSNATISINAPATSSLVAGANITVSTNGSTISIIGATVAASPLSLSAGASSDGLQSVVFSNSNGVSFGLNGSTITASHNGLTSQSNQAFSASGGSSAFQTLNFANGNGATFTNNAGSVGLSYTVPTVPTAYVSSVNGSSGAISFATGSSLSSSQNGSTITWGLASNITTALQSAGAYLTTQSAQAFSADASSTFQTLSFQNSNGVSFSNNAGAIRITHGLIGTATAITGAASITANSGGLSFNGVGLAGTTSGFTGGASISGSMTHNTAGLALSLSHPAWLTTAALSNHSHGNPTLALTNLSGTTASNSAGFTLSLSAAAGGGGGVTPVASASNGSFSFTTIAFSNANNVTFGTSAGSIITASVAAPGAAAENNWVNLLGANTAGNTTASGSTIGYSGINVTLSGTNGSVVNISAPATSNVVGVGGISISTAGSTVSISNGAVLTNFQAFEKQNNTTYSSMGQNSLYLQHFIPEDVLQFSSIELWARGSFVSSTNSQAYSQTIRYGIYSQDTGANSSRMTLAGSSSNVILASFNSNTAYGFTIQDGATSFTTTSGGTAVITNLSGPFHHYMPFSSTLQPNVKHALAIHVSSTTAVGTSPFRYAPMVQTVMNSLSVARLFNTGSQAASQTVIGDREMGVLSATTAALPSSYATTQLTIAVSRQQLPFMLEV